MSRTLVAFSYQFILVVKGLKLVLCICGTGVNFTPPSISLCVLGLCRMTFFVDGSCGNCNLCIVMFSEYIKDVNNKVEGLLESLEHSLCKVNAVVLTFKS